MPTTLTRAAVRSRRERCTRTIEYAYVYFRYPTPARSPRTLRNIDSGRFGVPPGSGAPRAAEGPLAQPFGEKGLCDRNVTRRPLHLGDIPLRGETVAAMLLSVGTIDRPPRGSCGCSVADTIVHAPQSMRVSTTVSTTQKGMVVYATPLPITEMRKFSITRSAFSLAHRGRNRYVTPPASGFPERPDNVQEPGAGGCKFPCKGLNHRANPAHPWIRCLV